MITCALEVCDEPFRSMATTMVEVCAYAGTGHVLKIQKLLHICSDHYEPEKVGTGGGGSGGVHSKVFWMVKMKLSNRFVKYYIIKLEV